MTTDLAAQAELIANSANFLEWQAIAVDGSKRLALLICKYITGPIPFHAPGGAITWEECSLRDDFNNSFFSQLPEQVKSRIVTTETQSKGNNECSTSDRDVVYDKVFALSIEEARRYFVNDASRIALNQEGDLMWWLRSPGAAPDCVSFVSSGGEIRSTLSVNILGVQSDVGLNVASGQETDGNYVFKGSGIRARSVGARPAFWLKV